MSNVGTCSQCEILIRIVSFIVSVTFPIVSATCTNSSNLFLFWLTTTMIMMPTKRTTVVMRMMTATTAMMICFYSKMAVQKE